MRNSGLCTAPPPDGRAMGDQQIAVVGAMFQIFQVADQHRFDRQLFQDGGMCRRHGRADRAAHLGQPGADAEQQIRFRADGDALATEMKMSVQHRVHQLAALPP